VDVSPILKVFDALMNQECVETKSTGDHAYFVSAGS
jgi:hypothetical protein